MLKDTFANNRGLIISGVFILFNLVGLIGLSLPSLRPSFLQVIPLHLLFMFILIGINHHQIDNWFLLFIILTCSLGFAAEWLGVHTNILFGKYHYGQVLGIKLAGIPLTICINWFIVIYTVGVTTIRLKIKNTLARILVGAIILVLLDLLIEPVAIRFDYRQWQANSVPFFNYVSWFFLSVIMLYFFELFKFKRQNWAATILLISQFVFFGVFNIERFV